MSAAKCYGAIDHSSNQWQTKNAEKREEMACKASLFINLSLGPEYRHICVSFKPRQAKELYEKIRNMFIKNDVETRMMLTERLTSIQWTTSDHVDSFLAKIARVRTAYKNANVPLDETELFCRMLMCLPQEFDVVKMIMKGWAQPDFDRARVVLMQTQEELRKRKAYHDANPLRPSDSSAYIMENQKRKREDEEKGQERKKRNVVCAYCFRVGHVRKFCHIRDDDKENGVDRECVPDNELPKHAKERKEKMRTEDYSISKEEKEKGHAHVSITNEDVVSSFKIIDDDQPDGWFC